MQTTNGYHNGHAIIPAQGADAPRSDEARLDMPATTRLLLETQQTISRLIERYLETQERILLHAAPPVAPMIPLPAPMPAPVPEVAPPATPAFRSSRKAMPDRLTTRAPENNRLTPVQRGVMPAAAPTVRPERSAAAAPAPAAPKPSEPAASDGPPSTEQFRQDLLQVVSARTGYPVDALDETLHLESALGIDSIKTVEIFSKLKPYHVYFRADGQEEEELLAEFTKMKTLRDIVQSYDRRRQAHVGKGSESAADGSVKRYEVVPVAAPATMNGVKKNYLSASSSS